MTPLQEFHSKKRPKNPIFTEFHGRMMSSERPYSLLSYTVRHLEEMDVYRKMYWLELTFEHWEGIEQLLETRNLSNNTGSVCSLQQLSTWYMDCFQNHELCKRKSPSTFYRPTRLLDISRVGEQDTVHLVNSADVVCNEPYMTLSHCWGDTKPLRHTAQTKSKLESGIALGEFPKTFQNATTAAQTMHCRYLWIDSLCIVQDDWKDWQVEAAQMDRVYSNSALNIAATGSTNSLGGLFFARDPSDIKPCKFNPKSKGAKVPEHALLITPHRLWEQMLEKQPMRSRGWCFQERMLSCRMVDFTSKQLMWRCHELVACETFPRGFPPNVQTSPITLDLKLGKLPSVQKVLKPEDSVTNALSLRRWEELVMEYSISF